MQDQWNQRYGDATYFYGIEPNDFLREKVHLLPARGRILTLAEGEGRNAIFLARQGFKVTAVDWSEVGLAKLSTWAKSEGLTVETVCGDINKFDFGSQNWDGIVSIWFHQPSGERKELYPKIERALTSGGVFLLESYTPKQLSFKTGGPQDVDMLVHATELKSSLNKLQIEHCLETERDIHEGRGHNGRSAVVQLVARLLT